MAELILTQQEKDAALWSDLDDEALGKVVKKSISALDSVAKQFDRIEAISIALYLASYADDNNSTKVTIDLEGVTRKGVDIGNWTVTIERKAAD